METKNTGDRSGDQKYGALGMSATMPPKIGAAFGDPGVARERARHRRHHDENQRKDLRDENDRAPNGSMSGSFALRRPGAHNNTARYYAR